MLTDPRIANAIHEVMKHGFMSEETRKNLTHHEYVYVLEHAERGTIEE